MKKLLLCVLYITAAFSYGQTPVWNAVPKQKLATAAKLERSATPIAFHTFTLNLHELQARLQDAPSRNSGQVSNAIIPFPTSNGKLENFRVYEASVLHPDLAVQHPGIKSYIGSGVENPGTSVRFSITMFGVHAMILSDEGTTYTDPYTTDLQNYIVYSKKDVKAARTFRCGVTDDPATHNAPPSTMADDGVFRTYRLALACTIEYAAYHVNAAGLANASLEDKKDAVLAAMNVTMTRVNGVYERDMSLTMQIVPNNENIIFITSDNLQNNNEGALINQIQAVIDNGIGWSNYDIGHVFSTGGGGVASLGSVCSQFKAEGVTGRPAPINDPFDIDYVAHEMGHQFGATHTFNNSFQRSAGTAVEPGSGSTIMAYAGISAPNVQNNSDDYFHAVSLNQMFNFVNGGGGCATEVANNNTPPIIAPLPTYNIPKGTAFILKGNATDTDGDTLTYCWEQTNSNGANATVNQPPSANSTTGPNFRSLDPSLSPNRYMPALSSVLNNDLTPTWEVVPSVGRALNFALTVRDNNTPNGGQTARRNMNVIAINAAGPFTVTSQNQENISWEHGSSQTITWNVAGTTGNGINTASVNILLSTDGGLTWPTVLAANTPNDGSQTVTAPNVDAASCRIMVEAAGNIYYAVNQNPFSIGVEVITECTTYTNNTATAIPDNNDNLTFSVINVPGSAIIQSVKVGVNITHTYVGDLGLLVARPDESQAILWQQLCGSNNDLNVTFSDTGSAVSCGSPTTGLITPVQPLSVFEGAQAQGDWLLAFADFGPGDTGTVNSWSLEICSQSITAVDELSLKNFTLYPNPNNGSFTVGFTSDTANAIRIGVHDMRGRAVYNADFENTGLFSGNINLSNVQSGVYLVTVEDGAKKAVRKVIIK
ncbi:reprolysin-like metallopeptidase [uncultured Flavobacterium sp.]|uniref:zinc-dependent metalloprotease n=1 Tax=uncultured Flavobacterium sp. TaxID=165435 RepID=UPI0025D2FD3C|nr:zinc-dependent metalloprotease family protein [uncultured Flavobacterium sp.]